MVKLKSALLWTAQVSPCVLVEKALRLSVIYLFDFPEQQSHWFENKRLTFKLITTFGLWVSFW
jgi:hypothetical protein